MSQPDWKQIADNGLWRQNAGLVQLLGLCPLLAISTTVVNSVSLGLATALVMALASAAVASVRNFVPHEVRLPVFILIIAALVTVVELVMNVWFHGLYLVLGIFVPLIVTNCIVLARAETFASKNAVLPSALDGLMMGIGLTVVLVCLGSARELIGTGALFAGLDLVLPAASDWSLRILPADYPGFLLAVLPPGAFIGLGCLIALKNHVDQRRAAKVRNVKNSTRDVAAA